MDGIPPVLAMTDVHKSYGGVHALRGANFTAPRYGAVHGLIGANGSGKSTLLNILSGQQRPTRGSVTIEGRNVNFGSPRDALKHGIAMVSQEIAVVPQLSIAENILFGRSKERGLAGISWPRTERKARLALTQLGLDYDPARLVCDLRPDERQMVEIARALAAHARVLVLDEPTSSLTDDEVEGLFTAVRRLRQQSVAVIFVSHRLDELFALCDHLTILRDGRTAAVGSIAEFTRDDVVEAMVGQTVSPQHTPRPQSGRRAGRAVEITELEIPGVTQPLSLSVPSGEVVGLAGLVGSGRSELLEGLFGTRPALGRVAVGNQPSTRPTSPKTAIAQGIGFVPADRKNQGLVLGMSIAANLNMVKSSRRNRLASPANSDDDDPLEKVAAAMRIRTPSLRQKVGNLSGGNQQKVVLGKWVLSAPTLLLLDEPTRGVDVAAKEEIYGLLRRIADEGTAVLISSSENSELLRLCDRIIVLFRGEVVADLPRAEATETILANFAGGHS